MHAYTHTHINTWTSDDSDHIITLKKSVREVWLTSSLIIKGLWSWFWN